MQINTMKTIWLLILLLFIPAVFHAQKTLTGLWIGELSNDSSTVRRDQSFEIALTQYKQKVYGYSRATFIVNDTLYYIVKRVKGTIEGDLCEIKDDEIISYNFRGKIDKGVKVTTTFRMNRQDSSWRLAGNWSTNQTKRFYSITGKVDLKDEPDIEKSKIFPHLEELNLAKDVPFYAEAKKPPVPVAPETRTIARNEPTVKNTEKTVAIKKEENTSTRTSSVAVNKPAAETKKPAEVKPEPQKTETVAVNKPTEEKNRVVASVTTPELKKTEPVVTKNPVQEKTTPVETINQPVKKQDPPVAAINTEQKKTVVEPPVETKKQDPPAAIVSSTSPKTETPLAVNKPAIVSNAAAQVNERKTVEAQQVNFVSDSLQLALYDNGEVDGDTVSVLLNGELILIKQGLKATAIKKTIYIQPGQAEFILVLYAENLGKYAPNTGLLVVYDGEERYQLRFSADLQQNAAVIFKRKK
jgi:archaellum component FlaF (FlaF/FlaG flagellin family)